MVDPRSSGGCGFCLHLRALKGGYNLGITHRERGSAEEWGADSERGKLCMAFS